MARMPAPCLLFALLLTAGPVAAAPPDCATLDIASARAGMAAGDFDSRQLVQACLQRIAALDRDGPALHAILETHPGALQEAGRRDEARRAGHRPGSLQGIPIVLKDNIDAAPMANSAGSLALADFHPRQDAPLVRRLRAAGAVILAKTNLSEWANFRSTHSIGGWSARGGQTRNPYVLDRTPCGSSSGTAVAVAAGMAVAGVGTETDGSLMCPAAVNGLVAIKPTVGLVSRRGIIPISASQDTAGPMARNVADAAALLTVMAGPDPDDPATRVADRPAPADYRQALDAGALRGVRIGVLRNRLTADPAIAARFEAALEVLRGAGAQLVDATITTDGQWSEDETRVLRTEFKHGLDRYLQSHDAPVASLAALIAYNDRHAESEMPLFGQETFIAAQATAGLDDADYLSSRARAHRLAGPEGIDRALAEAGVQALVAPATGPAWPIDPARGGRFPGAGYSAAAVSGYPSITVPMGSIGPLPVGLLFMGPAWSEARLVGLAYAYEQRRGPRPVPAFLPTLDATP